MSKYTGPTCRLCRQEGEKLFLKGERCETQKCAVVRKHYAPGGHGKSGFRKLSEYGKQLRAKQRLKRIFRLSEKQFSLYYKKAARKKGKVTGSYFLELLERRLDNVIYKAGIAASRDHARQIVSHGLIKLNGKKVDIPSIQVKVGDKFEVFEKSKSSPFFAKLAKKKDLSPKWLKVDLQNLSGEVITDPQEDDLELNSNVQMIIEYYSK